LIQLCIFFNQTDFMYMLSISQNVHSSQFPYNSTCIDFAELEV
jgi:hypothetical protein